MTYILGQVYDEYPPQEIIAELNADQVAHLEPTEDGKWVITKNAEIPHPVWERLMVAHADLANTDYLALKYFEGYITEEEYAPIKAKREALREKIRELEAETESQ